MFLKFGMENEISVLFHFECFHYKVILILAPEDYYCVTMALSYCLFLVQTMKLQPPKSITDAYVLLNLGDSVTTDHISPAGNIARNSPAARYLTNRG